MKLLVLPGDGVGPEIVAAALAVLDALAARQPLELEHETVEIGLAALASSGTTLPEGVLERARAADGVVLGPIDHMRYPDRDRGGINVLLPTVFAVAHTSAREPARRRPPRGERQRSPNGGRSAEGALYLLIFLLALTALLRSAGEGAARSFFNVYLELDLAASPARIGLLLAVGQVAAGPAALVAPALAARAGKVPVIVVTGLVAAAGMVILAAVPHWVAAGLGFTLVIGLRAVTQSVSSVLHMEIVPGRPAHGHLGSGGAGPGLHVDLVRRRLPDSGHRLPRPPPAGRGHHRRRRGDLLALLPRTAG